MGFRDIKGHPYRRPELESQQLSVKGICLSPSSGPEGKLHPLQKSTHIYTQIENPSTADLYEFKASLVYIWSSRIARAT